MCYNCGVCFRPQKPGTKRLVYLIHRTKQTNFGPRQEIAKEIPVCLTCKNKLDNGVPLNRLYRIYNPSKVEAVQTAHPSMFEPVDLEEVFNRR